MGADLKSYSMSVVRSRMKRNCHPCSPLEPSALRRFPQQQPFSGTCETMECTRRRSDEQCKKNREHASRHRTVAICRCQGKIELTHLSDDRAAMGIPPLRRSSTVAPCKSAVQFATPGCSRATCRWAHPWQRRTPRNSDSISRTPLARQGMAPRTIAGPLALGLHDCLSLHKIPESQHQCVIQAEPYA